MKVKLQYISLVKSYTNNNEDEFSLPQESTVSDALQMVADKYGKQFSTEVYDPINKEMKPTFVTMVNGVLMDQLKGINTPLKDGDSLIIMALMTGG